MTEQRIKELIKQKRLEVLVHSYLYYDLNKNIITDIEWSKIAFELVELQKQYPSLAKQVEYAEDFEEFDGSSGCDLQYRSPNIVSTGQHLLLLQKINKL